MVARDTKSHPYFNVHILHSGINIRPRAITYTRKNSTQIHATQKFPSATPISDYCWVEVNNTTFLNMYKAPNDPKAVEPLLEWVPTSRSVIVGDFNSVHWA